MVKSFDQIVTDRKTEGNFDIELYCEEYRTNQSSATHLSQTESLHLLERYSLHLLRNDTKWFRRYNRRRICLLHRILGCVFSMAYVDRSRNVAK